MKHSRLFVSILLSCAFAPLARSATAPINTNATPGSVTYAVVSREANSRQWARIVSQTNAAGAVTTRTESAYKELATGICYQNDQHQWVDSMESIDITNDGAQFTQGRHKVHWMGNANTPGGAVHLVSPDHKDFLSRVYGLAYWDTSTGSNVLISPLQDCQGVVVGDNVVTYTNAFSGGVTADLEYICTKDGLEQNVILRTSPPSPDTLGLNPQTTRLQVLTEFMSPPIPEKTTDTSGAVPEDSLLDFGEMKIGLGNAFFIQGDGEAAPIKQEKVLKRWVQLDGRFFLIEEIPYPAISNAVENLPPHASATNAVGAAVEHIASLLPLLPRKVAAAQEPKPVLIAQSMPPKPGLVIDYSQMSASATNFDFQGNVTYYVSGIVNLYGASYFEGGTVIKYSTSSSSTLNQADPNGSFVFASSPYRPAVFTSANANDVGDTISGSSGSPAQGQAVYLQWSAAGNDATPTITDARFSYAGVAFQANTTNYHLFQDCQFVSCGTNVSLSHDTNVFLYNVLAANCGAVVNGAPVVDAENLTVDSCTKFDTSTAPGGGVTNSIFTAVSGGTNGLTFCDCVVSNSGSKLYWPVGSGHYYLTNNPFTHSNGTVAINPWLLSDLQGQTTHPPIVYSNATISAATNLGIQAARDFGSPGPDLGYHYVPLDYVFGGTQVNQNLTFAPGTAVGYFNASSKGYGISMANDMVATFQGTEQAPVWWVRANTVQEARSDTNWSGVNIVGGLVGLGDSQSGGSISLSPEMRLFFTHASVLGNGDNGWGQHFRDDSAYLIVRATNCEFHGGQLCYGYVNSCFFTNCLMDRTACAQTQGFAGDQYIVQNCTFHGGAFFMVPNNYPIPMSVRDSAFDGTSILDYSYGTNTSTASYDYNAFTNASSKFAIGGAHDQILTNGFNWEASWLGSFYLPTNSPALNMGDVTADRVGLYHFTTQTNQTPQGFSQVDMGYHYVAVDADGNPLDTNDDGIPDYLEDANGNGRVDNGETSWLLGPYDGLSYSNGIQVFTPLQ
jgi:hypothetical protein